MKKCIIEVGAYDGKDSLKYHKQGFTVYTFEPNKKLFSDLFEKTKDIENYNVFNKAVCSFNGKTDFNICKSGGASSILKFRDDETLIKNWGKERTDVHYSGESYVVETTRLDTFIEEQQLENTIIEFIHIDAQGVDLDCLKSVGKYIKNVRGGVLETVKNKEKSIYIGQDENTLENIQTFLTNNGFKIMRISGNDRVQCEFNVYFKKI
jgi:FkbM family methyltransferase